MGFRDAKDISLEDVCPHCGRRTFFPGDTKSSKRRYSPPPWFREMFKIQLGVFPLCYYRLYKCEVCGRTLAVFDENIGLLKDKIVVLYSCTLLSKPLAATEKHRCEDFANCYGCPLKQERKEQHVLKA
jgi:hypothetical protein